MTPSPQQEQIYDWIKTGSGSLIIEAVAGSGKTTTIVEASKLIKPGLNITFLAFNRNIVAELKSRLPYWVQCNTFHSKCLGALKLHLPKPPKIDGNKTRHHLEKLCENKTEFFEYAPFVQKLVGLAKSGLEDEPKWKDIIAYHDLIFEEDVDLAIEYANLTLESSNKDLDVIDFDDMLYLTHRLNAPFRPLTDWLFVDEVQDLSPLQHALLGRMIKPDTGRGCFVGDSFQAIYAFRGADSDSMDKLKLAFNCSELPLSVSYRCAQEIVNEARRALGAAEQEQAAMSQELCPWCEEALGSRKPTCDNCGHTIFCPDCGGEVAKHFIDDSAQAYLACVDCTWESRPE